MNAGPIERWNKSLDLLRSALREADLMRTAPKPTDRDRATADYVTAVDAMVDELGELKDCGALNAVSDFLEVTYGKVS